MLSVNTEEERIIVMLLFQKAIHFFIVEISFYKVNSIKFVMPYKIK